MKLFSKSTQRTAWLVLALCLLVTLSQCSPPPEPGGRFATKHENVRWLDVSGGSSEYPAWSPDGTQIAFEHMEERLEQGNIYPTDIYVANSDGTGKRRLAPAVENNFSCHGPAWAPDSRRLVVACNVDGDFDLYIVDVPTGSMTQLTDYPADEAAPAWSPDGTRIAFEWLEWSTDDVNSLLSSIYVIGSDGHNLERLTMGPDDSDPAWSPDSQRISFTSYKSKHPAGEQDRSPYGMLCIIQADGSALTCRDDTHCIGSAWSPDGSLLACISGTDILALQIASESVITLLDDDSGYYIQGLSWSPDRTKLVFSSGLTWESAYDLYILNVKP